MITPKDFSLKMVDLRIFVPHIIHQYLPSFLKGERERERAEICEQKLHKQPECEEKEN